MRFATRLRLSFRLARLRRVACAGEALADARLAQILLAEGIGRGNQGLGIGGKVVGGRLAQERVGKSVPSTTRPLIRVALIALLELAKNAVSAVIGHGVFPLNRGFAIFRGHSILQRKPFA